jgi:prephenate dehydrogenase
MDFHKNDHISEIAHTKISIVGFGNFGKFMAKQLVLTGFEVFVTDTTQKIKEAKEIGAKFVSLNESVENKIVILAVPMEKLEETLKNIKDKIKAGSLVLDVCSLKIFSCKLMKKILPKNIEIIGTHPLFGPQSARNSIIGMKIALVNVSAKKETFEIVNDFCLRLGLKTIITTAQEHDRQMAVSQALTHFIGQICKKVNINRVEMSTKTFDDLMNIIEVIKNDTSALFNNMQQMNPFAGNIRNDFIQAALEINNKLNSESRRN